MSEMTQDQIDDKRAAASERIRRAAAERDILIKEVQENHDIIPADKDHLRDALNMTYAAANGSQDRLADLATSGVLWARMQVRGFASDLRIQKALQEIKDLLTNHLNAEANKPVEDLENMKWPTLAKKAALAAPAWFFAALTSIFVALIMYGFGDRIIKGIFGV